MNIMVFARAAARRLALAVSLTALTVAVFAPKSQAQNYLHAVGSQIFDSNNNPVRITGINWFGFETTNYCPHGLWARSMSSYLDQVKALGYNTLRVPYCSQMFDSGSVPNGIDFSQNPTLQGLTPIQILDQLVAGCQSRGIKIILDRHRPDSGAQSALWYTDQYSEQRWISDWTMLASRYAGNDTVIGCDLHNEPHSPATWGTGDTTTDWRLAAERCGNAILAVNPNLLIYVEGIDTYNGDGYWWGGNLEGVASAPVQLTNQSQLVYSIHDYPSSVASQPWFSAPNYPDNLPGVWDKYWGYIVHQNIAPVWIGEFGTLDQTTSDQQWFASIANYISANSLNFTYWCLNPNSGDTGGILEDDWTTVNQDKQSVLQPLLAPQIGSGGGSILSGHTYVIVNVNSGEALDDTGWSTTHGTYMEQWDNWGGPPQQWILNNVGNGNWTIVNSYSQLALDDYGWGTTNGTLVDEWDNWGGPPQQWKLVPYGDGSYEIVSSYSNLAVEVYNWSTTHGAAIDLWQNFGNANQRWVLQQVN